MIKYLDYPEKILPVASVCIICSWLSILHLYLACLEHVEHGDLCRTQYKYCIFIFWQKKLQKYMCMNTRMDRQGRFQKNLKLRNELTTRNQQTTIGLALFFNFGYIWKSAPGLTKFLLFTHVKNKVTKSWKWLTNYSGW